MTMHDIKWLPLFRMAILMAVFFLSFGYLGAQSSAIPPTVRAVNTLERLTDSNGLGTNEMMYGIPIPPGKVVGNTYLSTAWRQSAILLYKDSKLIEGYPVRYDIQGDELDVKTSKGIKVLEGRTVKSFMWVDSAHTEPSYFVNAGGYKLDGVPQIGFFEVLVDGKAPLFKRTRITMKKADYNEALSIGSRDDKILKETEYYISQSAAVNLLPGTKKKFVTVFPAKRSEVEKFIDDNDLSVKKELDLVQIFKYYNSLVNQ
ncbi:MAG TPA: hypothetical protein VK666_05095 [Chryseolinea sp.]|nr:hypothetical protein [Chryseolinea sp.]